MTGTDGPRQQLAAALHSVGYRGTESAVTALLPVVTAWAEQQWLRIREAHDWQCDCDPDDPCRTRIALTEVRAAYGEGRDDEVTHG
jgi:hypothetical protein